MAGVIILLAGAAGCARSREARRDQFLKSGKAHLADRDFQRAVLDFRNAAATAPRDAECFYQLGLAYVGAHDLQGAWDSFRTALSLDPHHRGAKLNLAMIQVSMPDPDRVKEGHASLQEILDSGPVDASALHLTALSELRLGELEVAERHLRQALAAQPSSLANLSLLAQARLARGDRVGASEVLESACRDNPRSADARLLLARFRLAMNQTSAAEQDLGQALAIDPNFAPALLLLGKLEAAAGRNSDAERTFRHLSDLSDPGAKPVYALFLFGQNRTSDAIHEFERLSAANPDDRGARSRLVAAYWQAGRAAEAEELLSRILRKNPSDVDALVQRAEMFLTMGRVRDAQNDLYAAVRLEPNAASAHYKLAQVYRTANNPLAERKELFEVLRLTPANLAARVDLARSFLVGKSPKTALDLLNEAPAYQREMPSAVTQRNWALWAAGDLPALRHGIATGLTRERTPDLLLQSAMLDMHDGRHEAARSALEEVLAIAPEDLRAAEGLRQSYVAQKKNALAIRRIEEFAARHPRSAAVQAFWGSVLESSGDKSRARRAFEAALSLNPGLDAAQMALAKLDYSDGRRDEAAARLEKLVGNGRGGTAARYWLGNVEASRGRFQEAVNHFQRVVETDPNHAQALNNLAYLMLERSDRIDEALKYAQKALELEPDNPIFEDSLGWALYRKGLYSLAARYLEQAVARRGADPVSQYHLAMVYAKAGNSRKAHATLDAALERHPQLPEARLAREVVGSATP
jgi:tetratricopeptide (TPR) repeat protein